MSEKASNPYVGPVPFTVNDAARFYGREGDLRRLMVLFVAQRIVLLYSPSGAGKTSLVQARMIPALDRKGFEVLPTVRVSQRPVDGSGAINKFIYSTVNAFADAEDLQPETPQEEEPQAGAVPPNTRPDPENGAVAGADLISSWKRKREALGNKRAVMFFDQFEEVLTVDPHDDGQKIQFFDQLGAILEEDDRLWAIFAIREDYLAELDPFRHLIPGELDSKYRLELLNEGQALAAVQKPAGDAGVAFSDEAAAKLVGQLKRVTVRRRDGQITSQEGRFVEPVQLQVVCQSLWAELEPEVGGTIQAASVAAEGHVDESLGEFYDKTVARIAAEHNLYERDIRDWFDRELISEQGLRAQVMGSEETDLRQEVIGDLVDAHLVRAEERRGIQWYELAHDRLVKPVRQSNESWYAKNLSLLQVRAEAWKRSRDEPLLLAGRELIEGQAWAEGKALKEYEGAFLKASSERERARTIRRVAAVVVLTVIVAVAVGMFLLWQNATRAEQDAVENANIAATSAVRATIAQGQAEQSAEEARAAEATSDHNANLAGTSEASAIESAANAEAQATIAAIQKAEAEAQALNAQTLALMSFSTSLLPANRNPIADEVERSLLMGAQALTTTLELDLDIAARLLDEQARRLLAYVQANPIHEVLRGHEDWVRSVAFSPDGAWLASGSDDQTIRLWALSDLGAEPVVLRGHESSVRSVAFSPDGAWLASGSADQTIRLWRSTLDGLAQLMCEQAGRNFTLEEWGEFLPGREYEITCPQYPAPATID